MKPSPGTAQHRWFLALLGGGFVILLALLELTFVRFPSSVGSTGTGPKANVAIWFGPDGARQAYLALGLLFAALYICVGSQSSASASAWRPGAMCGLALGGIWLIESILVDGLSPLAPVQTVSVLALPALALAAGLLGARATGRARDGVLAGFWCGVVAAVIIAVSIVALDNAFATTLVGTTWAKDPTCPQRAGRALAGCVIGDDLGFVAMALTLMPLLLAGIGAGGGAIGASAAVSPRWRQGSLSSTANRVTSWRAPLIFSGALLALFVAEVTLKIV